MLSPHSQLPWVVLFGVAALGAGCGPTEELVGPGGQPPVSSDAGDDGGVGVEEPTSEVSRFRRLTHREWERTTLDLLGLGEESGLSKKFRRDPTQSGYLFEGNADALEVDQNLWSAYRSAAAELARRVVSDAELLEGILPRVEDGSASDDERAELFVRTFGQRAHRRPLQNEQVQAYLEVYEKGKTTYADSTGFSAGIRLVLEAFLQSPYFLYRVEESADEVDGALELDSYERASRLSYFLWGTMPDEELFEAAATGALEEAAGLRAQAERLLSDARAADIVVHFFERVLDVERYQAILPSESAFPDVPAALAESAAEETSRFLASQMYEKAGSLRDLLTSTTTFVDEHLARIYGLEGEYDSSFAEVSLSGEQRRGILTQVGFLAAHATSTQPDPIHRGVFVARRLACITIAAPPDNVPPLPPSTAEKSNRQVVADHTEAEGTMCRTCHALTINPFGFTFEHYDAVGAYRQMDGAFPVDATATVRLDGAPVEVTSAVELAEALAGSRQVHDCFSGYLVASALGRPRAPGDDELVTTLGSLSLEGAVPFRDLMSEVAVTIALLSRAPSPEDPEP